MGAEPHLLRFEPPNTGLRTLSVTLCTKFEVCRPFRSEDMTHFRLSISQPGDLDP